MHGALGSRSQVLATFAEFGECQVCGRPAMLEFITDTAGVFTHHYEPGDLEALDDGDSEVLGCEFTYQGS